MPFSFREYTLPLLASGNSDPTRSIVVIMAICFQTELMVEICFQSLVRDIGKVLLMKCS